MSLTLLYFYFADKRFGSLLEMRDNPTYRYVKSSYRFDVILLDRFRRNIIRSPD